ncbi:hypothetical protein GCM10010336_65150 [Streptomyces goshikiensis]|nr:hypothetical protein GCM10010336_65150 [Streptomyces goshikiensis]
MQGKTRHNRLNLADAHPVPPTRPFTVETSPDPIAGDLTKWLAVRAS